MTPKEVAFMDQCQNSAREMDSVSRDYILRSENVKKRWDALASDDMFESVCGTSDGEVGALWSAQAANIPPSQEAAYVVGDHDESLQDMKDGVQLP